MFTTCCCLTAVIPLSSNPSNHRTWRLLVHRNTDLTLDKNLTEPHLTSKPLNYSFRTHIPGGGEGTTTDIEGQPIGVCAVLIGCDLGFILRVCDVKKRDDDSSIDCFRHFIRQKCPKLAGWSLLNIKISSFSCVHLTINQLTLEIIRS